jgi:hypothetical protein
MVGLMTGENNLSNGTSTTEQIVGWWSRFGFGEGRRIAAAIQRALVSRYTWTGSTVRNATPWEARSIRSERTRAAARANARWFVWVDTSSVPELQEHRWTRIEQYDKLASRGYRPDDLNDYFDLGLPPHPTNVGMIPFAVQAVDTLGRGVERGDQPKTMHTENNYTPAAPPRASIGRVDGLLDQLSEQVSALGTRAAAGDADRDRWEAYLKPRMKRAASRWSRFFIEQRGRVLAALEDATRSEREDLPAAESLFNVESEDGMLMARIRPIIVQDLEDGHDYFEEIDAVVPEVPAFEVDDPRVQAAIRAREIQAAKANGTTVDAIRGLVARALEEGLSAADLGDQIAGYYNDNCVGETAARPQTAARTQVAGTVNEGRMLAARSTNADLRKGWLHGDSADPRPAHIQAESTYLASPIGLDDDFVVNGYTCSQPGDARLPPGEVCNCTCSVVFDYADTEGDDA